MPGQDGSDRVAGIVTGVSVSHRNADVSTIETAVVPDSARELDTLLGEPAVEEAFLLQTCNRAERYVVTQDSEAGREVLQDRIERVPADACTWLDHTAALEHLMRVSAGLESMVIGEDQILGQLRRAWETANEMDALGPLLDESVWKAIHLGKRARTETGINDGVQSLSRAAVTLAIDHARTEDPTGAVLGAGRMAQRTLTAMVDSGVRDVRIVNRTRERACELAGETDARAEAFALAALPDVCRDVDFIVTATAANEPLITPHMLVDASPAVIVDLGQPRDVDLPANTPVETALLDLDDIESMTEATSRDRNAAVAAVEAMIEEELDDLQAQLKRRQADEVIAAMYASAEEIKRREFAEARSLLADEQELSAVEVEILESFADALVGQLMAAPTKSLREAAENDDWETIQAALQLFDPEFPDGRATRESELIGSIPEQAPIEDDR